MHHTYAMVTDPTMGANRDKKEQYYLRIKPSTIYWLGDVRYRIPVKHRICYVCSIAQIVLTRRRLFFNGKDKGFELERLGNQLASRLNARSHTDWTIWYQANLELDNWSLWWASILSTKRHCRNCITPGPGDCYTIYIVHWHKEVQYIIIGPFVHSKPDPPLG